MKNTQIIISMFIIVIGFNLINWYCFTSEETYTNDIKTKLTSKEAKTKITNYDDKYMYYEIINKTVTKKPTLIPFKYEVVNEIINSNTRYTSKPIQLKIVL